MELFSCVILDNLIIYTQIFLDVSKDILRVEMYIIQEVYVSDGLNINAMWIWAFVFDIKWIEGSWLLSEKEKATRTGSYDARRVILSRQKLGVEESLEHHVMSSI